MPPQPTVAQRRLNNIVACLAAAADTLKVLANSLKNPILEAISNTTLSLSKCAQMVKQNKKDCIQLMEETHELLNAIIIVHVKSDTNGELPPTVSKTLHKIYTFVEAQQEGNKIRKFFRQGEMNTLLKDCKAGIQQGLEFFQVTTVRLTTDVREMQQYAERRHQEVLDMIVALSDATSSDSASSVWNPRFLMNQVMTVRQISQVFSSSHNSSTSIAMLPSEPKIFYGRESELADILNLFSQGTPRIAILGAGGMGKTTLARVVVHHTEVAAKYKQHRFFVGCDSAANKVELAAHIGAHLGLKPGNDLTRPVLHYFSSSPPSLLILDNLDTLWEPAESQGDIEEFLLPCEEQKDLPK
ncbi:hypothetical protein B0H13DRAFT_1916969 [Mycena leptocephala]|nr:hypothetical protein B0H13DRAFT_1916969 [Mycena leptocephala]